MNYFERVQFEEIIKLVKEGQAEAEKTKIEGIECWTPIVLPTEKRAELDLLLTSFFYDIEAPENKEFDKWHNFLLLAAARSGKYGMDHPIGSCLMRDIFRDKKVKAAIADAWERIVVLEEDPK